MKKIYILMLLILFIQACSNDKNDIIPEEVVYPDICNLKYFVKREFPFDTSNKNSLYVGIDKNDNEIPLTQVSNIKQLDDNLYLIVIDNKLRIYNLNLRTFQEIKSDDLLYNSIYKLFDENTLIFRSDDRIYFSILIWRANNKISFSNNSICNDPDFYFDLKRNCFCTGRNVFVDKNNNTLFNDGISLKVLLPSGKIVHYESDFTPHILFKNDLYSYDYESHCLTLNKLSISDDGSIKSETVGKILKKGNSICLAYCYFYNRYRNTLVLYTEDGDCYEFDGDVLTEKNNYRIIFERNTCNGQIANNGYVYSFYDDQVSILDLNLLGTTKVSMVDKNVISGYNLEQVQFFFNKNINRPYFFLFKGYDYNTGKPIFGKILSDNKIEIYDDSEIDKLYYDNYVGLYIGQFDSHNQICYQ